jgi:hypothetical protein
VGATGAAGVVNTSKLPSVSERIAQMSGRSSPSQTPLSSPPQTPLLSNSTNAFPSNSNPLEEARRNGQTSRFSPKGSFFSNEGIKSVNAEVQKMRDAALNAKQKQLNEFIKNREQTNALIEKYRREKLMRRSKKNSLFSEQGIKHINAKANALRKGDEWHD